VKARCVGVLVGALLIAGLGPVSSAVASPASMVALGQASTYAVLSGASVGNTVSAPGAPHTTLRGDLGVSANAQPTGFPPGVVTGATHIGSTAAQAHADLVTAYDAVGARTGGTAFAGDQAGATFSPGLYSAAAAVSNTGTLTLDGGNNPNAVFVFQVGGALTMAAGAHVTLINGASASRVFWRVNGAAGHAAHTQRRLDREEEQRADPHGLARRAIELRDLRVVSKAAACLVDSDEQFLHRRKGNIQSGGVGCYDAGARPERSKLGGSEHGRQDPPETAAGGWLEPPREPWGAGWGCVGVVLSGLEGSMDAAGTGAVAAAAAAAPWFPEKLPAASTAIAPVRPMPPRPAAQVHELTARSPRSRSAARAFS
jgi:hypothetical protein